MSVKKSLFRRIVQKNRYWQTEPLRSVVLGANKGRPPGRKLDSRIILPRTPFFLGKVRFLLSFPEVFQLQFARTFAIPCNPAMVSLSKPLVRLIINYPVINKNWPIRKIQYWIFSHFLLIALLSGSKDIYFSLPLSREAGPHLGHYIDHGYIVFRVV